MGFKTDTYIVKGMRQDMSDAVFDKAFSFENKNVRITSRGDSTTFSIEQEMGNTKMTTIELFQDLNYTVNVASYDEFPFIVIGYSTIDNYLVLFGVGSRDNDDIIARVELGPNDTWSMVYLYKGNLLGFDVRNPIETLPNIETASVKKVYFVDGVHQPRAINVMKTYPSNDVGDITLGTHLELNEEFSISKVWNHSGQYPGGKVQFAFSYLNLNGSETNLVEVSPMFDCTMTNNGISNNAAASASGNYTYAEHSFEVRITNLDPQYEFIRVYVIMTTSAGSTTIKYIERHLDAHDLFTEVIDYDEADLIDYTGTFADLNARETNIIPYTMATKDNFMFYGNIKEAFPDISDIVFDEEDFVGEFSLKKIGKEEYLTNAVYHYTPRLISYEGSNFEYMGFRKSNWYRFGIIVQHESGRWSDVIFLCDRQCDKSSETIIIYEDQPVESRNQHVPRYSEYYIPRFSLGFTQRGKDKLLSLSSMGFKKIKPVCVVPPPKYRNIISQGIVAPTLYKGENRLNLTNDYDFSIPSHFYRPKPLSSPLYKPGPFSSGIAACTRPLYSHTLRNTSDLKIRSNYIDSENNYLTNPTFTRVSDRITMNVPYREYRHGFSLPPKNTINAEFEFSAVSLNEYCYIDQHGDLSVFFGESYWIDDSWFSPTIILWNSQGTVMTSAERTADVPDKIWANTYTDTMFVDESVCTFNSPEIDLNDMFVNGVRNFLLDADIRICGYSQITGSYNRLRTANNIPTGDYTSYANSYMPTARHLYGISENPEVNDILDYLGKRDGNKQQVLPYFTGPFYFHPIKVLGLMGKYGKYDTGPRNVFPQQLYENNAERKVFSKTFKQYTEILFDWSFYGELKNRKKKVFTVEKPYILFDGDLVTISDFFVDGFHQPTFLTKDRINLSQFGLSVFYSDDLNNTHLSNHNFSLSPQSGVVAISSSDLSNIDLSTHTLYMNSILSRWYYLYDDILNVQGCHTNNADLEYDLGNYYFYPFIGNRTSYTQQGIPAIPMLLPNFDPTFWYSTLFREQSQYQAYQMVTGQWFDYSMTEPTYGGHYYMPFSTVFPHSLFEPLYACASYPFIHDNKESLIGTTQMYTNINNTDVEYSRPLYNNTSTLMYSVVTNYFDSIPFAQNKSIQGYHSVDENVGVRFTDIEWLKTGSRYLTLKYEYGLSSSSAIIFQYKTSPLVASMKWYRGFNTVLSYEDRGYELANLGLTLTFDSYMGNTAFSGMLPQRITKSGYTPLMYHDLNGGINTIDEYFKIEQAVSSGLNETTNLLLTIKYNVSPHIVFTDPDRITLLPEFTYIPGTGESQPVTEMDYRVNNKYLSEIYYPIFVHWSDFNLNNPVYSYLGENTMHNLYCNNAVNVYRSIYPHSGTWIDLRNGLRENYSDSSRKAFWQYYYNSHHTTDLNNTGYPRRRTITIDMDMNRLLMFDERGVQRRIENYWLLQLANLYNKNLEDSYSDISIDISNRNPYKYEGLSDAYWSWIPCGYSMRIDDIVTTMNTVDLKYDEGDTYFQRYNSIKSYKKPLSANAKNDISDVASIMIESYINLDGHYWDHLSLRSYEDNVLLFAEADTQSKINPVYTLNDGYTLVYHQRDTNYPTERHYPTRIMWSVRKINGEYVDSWGLVPASNYYDTLGTCGAVEKLVAFNDNVFCLQDHGFSVLDFNSKSMISSSTGNPISVYFQEGLRLQNNTYMSRDVGTLNKWSVVSTKSGIYWIDDTMRSFYRYPASSESFVPLDLSTTAGFKAWSNHTFNSGNVIWSPRGFIFSSEKPCFKANHDSLNNDIYWASKDLCIGYNELLQTFTAFYSYERVPYILNYKDSVYSLFYSNTSRSATSLYRQFDNYNHKLYGKQIESYVELLVNSDPMYDKIFNFIEYDAECFNPTAGIGQEYLLPPPNRNPYNRIEVKNSFQYGMLDFTSRNTTERFRTWRTELPREQGSINRIRSPWCKIKLWQTGQLEPGNNLPPYRDQLHYISVNYTIPDQPMKTNIRNA